MSAVASSAGGGAARAFWFLPRERFFLSAAISATFRIKFNTFSSSATPLLKPFSFPLLAGGSSSVDADTDVKSSSSSSGREIRRKQNNGKKTKNVVSRKEVQQQLQLQWLLSLSPARAQTGDSESETEAEVEADPEVADLPLDMPGFPELMPVPSVSGGSGNGDSNAWVLGIDPDTHGAIALLKPSLNGSSPEAQVYDAPIVKYMVGKRFRRRLDTRSIVSLMQSLGAPAGSMAYIEQATPIPCDGRLGWWSSGFSYGLWIGILVASGFSVIPVSSTVWKKYFDLPGGRSTKDVSRATACNLFPSLSPQLKRKKDHGRAEALLIATYGSMIWKQR